MDPAAILVGDEGSARKSTSQCGVSYIITISAISLLTLIAFLSWSYSFPEPALNSSASSAFAN